MFDKIEVNGPKAHPLYQWLKKETDGVDIEWNFAKFLVGKDGQVIWRYAAQTRPEGIAKDIEPVL